MKNILDLQPNKVYYFFNEITKIPHGSGNTAQIAQYCLDFAKQRNLEAKLDKGGNVVIYKNGSKGYENSESVILQGHLDMVCEKDANIEFDFEKDSLNVSTDGEFVWANGTTLGADNGIALAYVLAILDSDDIVHPPIEALFTADEETGMFGAAALDATLLKSKRLINIDSEEEGVLTVSCAGGVNATCYLPLNYAKTSENHCFYELSISSLTGGHSGIEINKNRKNAIKELGRMLDYISSDVNINICSIVGGNKINAIPRSCSAKICISREQDDKFIALFNQFAELFEKECAIAEPNIKIKCKNISHTDISFDDETSKKAIFMLSHIYNGIEVMNPEIPNMVETSLNLGIISQENDTLVLSYLVRSNSLTGKDFLTKKLQSFMKYIGGEVKLDVDYSAWEFKPVSKLRDIFVSTFKYMYNKEPEIASIHAGLECGMFSGILEDTDMISFGPNLYKVHTTEEKMDVASVERTWNYLLKILENLK